MINHKNNNLPLEFISFGMSDNLEDLEELKKLKLYKNLSSASFSMSNLSDEGLKQVTECRMIDNLNLQDTLITNKGISYLPKLKKLKYLRLKECEFIDDDCMLFINQIELLEDLQIQGTKISQKGLNAINNQNIRYLVLNIRDNNFSKEGLIEWSKRLPKCEILAKGDAVIMNGKMLNQ